MNYRIVILLIIFLFLMKPSYSQHPVDDTREIMLDRGWCFAPEGETQPYPATVQGTAHAALSCNRLLKTPLCGNTGGQRTSGEGSE